MLERVKALWQRYRELILYVFFGGVTTVVSLAACWLTLKLGVLIWNDNGEPTEFLDVLGSTVQWVSGVLVAFVTNKLWVFTDAQTGAKATALQLVKFSGARVGTYFLEVVSNLGAIALLELWHCPVLTLPLVGVSVGARFWAKVFTSVFVVIANYLISKLFVFRKKKTPQDNEIEKTKEDPNET
ncbi:MAG: GtrA family protein [Clostridia bacterium]|nr:GtrA family protein [Clostridia bacterium]